MTTEQALAWCAERVVKIEFRKDRVVIRLLRLYARDDGFIDPPGIWRRTFLEAVTAAQALDAILMANEYLDTPNAPPSLYG